MVDSTSVQVALHTDLIRVVAADMDVVASGLVRPAPMWNLLGPRPVRFLCPHRL